MRAMGWLRATAIGALVCGAVGLGAWATAAPAEPMHWCCTSDATTGFGACIRGQDECSRSTFSLVWHRQPTAACFDYRAIIRDEERTDCAPSMTTCEKMRADALSNRDHDGVTACEPTDANQPARRARFRRAGLAAGATAGLLALVLGVARLGARAGRKAEY